MIKRSAKPINLSSDYSNYVDNEPRADLVSIPMPVKFAEQRGERQSSRKEKHGFCIKLDLFEIGQIIKRHLPCLYNVGFQWRQMVISMLAEARKIIAIMSLSLKYFFQEKQD